MWWWSSIRVHAHKLKRLLPTRLLNKGSLASWYSKQLRLSFYAGMRVETRALDCTMCVWIWLISMLANCRASSCRNLLANIAAFHILSLHHSPSACAPAVVRKMCSTKRKTASNDRPAQYASFVTTSFFWLYFVVQMRAWNQSQSAPPVAPPLVAKSIRSPTT